MMALRAVLFDVDFTLVKPGPELGPEGYVRVAETVGMTLDPARYEEARDRAFRTLKRHPDFAHDEEVWIAFMAEIVCGMGGNRDGAYECGLALSRAWKVSSNFELYEDAVPVLEELRRRRLKIGLVSNTGRDLMEFIAHHRLDVDAAMSSGKHGRVKPHPTIFEAVLRELDVPAEAAAMVGDSIDDDVKGAEAVGMRAVLVDRDGGFPEFEPRIADLYDLTAVLGLSSAGGER